MRTVYFFLACLAFPALMSCNSGSGDKNTGTTDQSPLLALNESIRADSTNAILYVERAKYYYDNEGYDEAIADLQKALSMDSSQVEYYHLLADVYLDYFKSYQALKTLEKAADRFPQSILTLLKLSEFQLILKQHEASMRTINRILEQDPQEAEAYFMFGLNFEELMDTVRAINSYQKAVELDPDIVDAWIRLGQLHAALGNEIAVQFFDNAIRIKPGDPNPLFAKADYLTGRDDLEGALEVYRRLAIIDPQFSTAYFNSGLLYMDLDSFPKAVDQFDLAIKTAPTYAEAYYYRGIAQQMMNRMEEAREDFEQALRLAPDFEAAREALNATAPVN